MLNFVVNATDSAGYRFPIVLMVPTRSGESAPYWVTYPGVLSFKSGPAAIIASPAQSRGSVLCTGIDVEGGSWAAVEIDGLFSQFSRNRDGCYGAMALRYSGTGQTFPDTVVAATAGGINWSLQVP